MQKKLYLVLVWAAVLALAAACGGGGGGATNNNAGSGGPGQATNGETLFTQMTIGDKPGCRTCHSLDGTPLVGPTMQGIGTRAATRVEGQNADQYLHASIVNPNAHVVENFTQGLMPVYTSLTEQQVNDLVAYLLTLK